MWRKLAFVFATLWGMTGMMHAQNPGAGDFTSANLSTAKKVIGPVYQVDQFNGSDWGAMVNACVAAVGAAGGGTCDARNFTTAQAAAENVVVGDGKHSTTLLAPPVQIVFAQGYNLQFRSYVNIFGSGAVNRAGAATTTFVCREQAEVGCVQSYNEASAVTAVDLENFQIRSIGAQVSGSIGLNVGGKGHADVANSKFVDLVSGGFDVARQLGGDGGCTCYNFFTHVGNFGRSFGTYVGNYSKYHGDANSNEEEGGWSWASTGTGIDDAAGGGSVRIMPDIEGSRGHGIVMAGGQDAIIYPYLEANGTNYLNGRENALFVNNANFLPDQSTCTDCTLLTPASQLWPAGFSAQVTPASDGLLVNYDFVPRASPFEVWDTTHNASGLVVGSGPLASVWSRAGMYVNGQGGSGGVKTSHIPRGLPSGASARTLLALVKMEPSELGGTYMLGGWGGNSGSNIGWVGYINKSGYMAMEDSPNKSSGVVGPTINVVDGNFHLLAWVYDGDHVLQYVDGAASNATAVTENTTASTIAVGGAPWGGGNGFVGEIGLFSIYTTALSQTKLQSFYRELLLKTPGMVNSNLPATVPGTTAGSVQWSMPQQAPGWKQVDIYLRGYKNVGTPAQTFLIPTPFSTVSSVVTDSGSCSGISISGKTVILPSSMKSTQTGLCEIKGW